MSRPPQGKRESGVTRRPSPLALHIVVVARPGRPVRLRAWARAWRGPGVAGRGADGDGALPPPIGLPGAAAWASPCQAKAEPRDAPAAPGALPVSLRRARAGCGLRRPAAGFGAADGFSTAAGLRAGALRAAGFRAVVLRAEVFFAVVLRAVARFAAVLRAGPSSWRRRSCAPSCVRPARFCVPSFSRRAQSSSRPCEDWPSSSSCASSHSFS